jgi:hypothetical protein
MSSTDTSPRAPNTMSTDCGLGLMEGGGARARGESGVPELADCDVGEEPAVAVAVRGVSCGLCKAALVQTSLHLLKQPQGDW